MKPPSAEQIRREHAHRAFDTRFYADKAARGAMTTAEAGHAIVSCLIESEARVNAVSPLAIEFLINLRPGGARRAFAERKGYAVAAVGLMGPSLKAAAAKVAEAMSGLPGLEGVTADHVLQWRESILGKRGGRTMHAAYAQALADRPTEFPPPEWAEILLRNLKSQNFPKLGTFSQLSGFDGFKQTPLRATIRDPLRRMA